MPPSSMYSKDEKVLCFHHDILYDAKILEVRPKDAADKKSVLEYLVHYKGWKNTWDDWVLEDRLRKATEENRELAANLRREVEAAARQKNAKPTAKKRAMSDRSSVRDSEERGNSVPGRASKRARGEADLEKEETFQSRPSIRIVMPDNLKALIVDDWERVTKNGTVVKLPAPKPVRKILQDWRDEEAPKRTECRIDVDVLDECIAGILEYFDVMLDKLLLYRYERPQYRMFRKKYAGIPGKDSPVDVYGAEHLIRLFSLLPELLAQTNMDLQATQRLREELSKFSIWLSKNSEKYFRTEYISAEDAVVKKSIEDAD
ncbi:Chromatin modification-related protein eaf3 [Penicillium subrubescens]|uniref:Chromatin modification-related protein EAF3 n=1 Tax=Penicillium subrubescens TaxID=1316194 RepID=A0A1Q5UND0_9EURO|nr:Chromatin modification-related protein eaf3 [Penicillium subrubescens]KAJ5880305.1 Chromatin modification-related protein eaf3 [Penicillium subrubescens]OKP13987.1 Chromatin modification-related protein eaf3 [Penicillium subrubescens]